MNREELIKLLQSWLTTATDDNGNPIHVIMDVDIHEIATEIIKSSLPPAEGAEVTLPTDKDIAIEIVARFMANPHPNQRANYEREKKAFANGAIYVRELAQRLLPLHAQRIAEKMVEKMSPSNEQIHEAALAWARDHSEAPDKDCPDWLIRDYEAGAYFVRQCYGCWNKTDKMVSERLREELIAYDKWAMRHLNGSGKTFTAEGAVDEYLESRYK